MRKKSRTTKSSKTSTNTAKAVPPASIPTSNPPNESIENVKPNTPAKKDPWKMNREDLTSILEQAYVDDRDGLLREIEMTLSTDCRVGEDREKMRREIIDPLLKAFGKKYRMEPRPGFFRDISKRKKTVGQVKEYEEEEEVGGEGQGLQKTTTEKGRMMKESVLPEYELSQRLVKAEAREKAREKAFREVGYVVLRPGPERRVRISQVQESVRSFLATISE